MRKAFSFLLVPLFTSDSAAARAVFSFIKQAKIASKNKKFNDYR
jgi:hypothetical protein